MHLLISFFITYAHQSSPTMFVTFGLKFCFRDNDGQVVAPERNQPQTEDEESDDSSSENPSDSDDDNDGDFHEVGGNDDDGGDDDHEGDMQEDVDEDNDDEDNDDVENDDDMEANRDEDGEDELPWHALGNRPLYRGAQLNVAESVAAVLTFMIDHNLDSSTVNDLFKLIHLHCLPEDLVKLSMYKLKKYFSFVSGPVKKHYYCSLCQHSLPTQDAMCPICNRRRAVSSFVQTPIVPQLKRMFKRPNFFNSLQHRFFFRQHLNEGEVGDIYDGQLYRESIAFLSQPNNFSMTYFVDGVPVFKSKNYSFWGFYLTINELPYKERVKRENTLLAGVWLGKKPNANLFLSAFVADFQRLFRGVHIYAEGLHQEIFVRGMVLAGVADTPARSTFYNAVHHNGYYGCPLCEAPGEQVQLPTGSQTHAYRYEQNLIMRTVDGVMAQARQALEIADDVRGVKGPTGLRVFMPNYLRGTGIDIMHLVQGLMKKFIELLFGSKYSGNGFSLREALGVGNRLLLSMKPPSFIHRYPQKINEWKHWKASEHLAWFYYYSVPILKEIMRPVFFDHYLKLVLGISYLSARNLSQEMINKANQLLHLFVRDFQELYGIRHCSINIHMLLHVSGCVKELGPLWAYSCFPYENINGQILRDIHGKSSVASQITRMHWETLKLPCRTHALPDGPVKDYCLKRHGQLKITERIAQSCYVIGKYMVREADNLLIGQGLRTSNVNFRNVKPYYRLLKEECVYVSEKYGRDIRSNSSCASFLRRGTKCYGCIYIFVKALQCACGFECNCEGQHFAIIRGAEKIGDVSLLDEGDTSLQYLFRSRMTLNVFAVPIQDLITVCFLMSVNGNMYIAERVNNSNNE